MIKVFTDAAWDDYLYWQSQDRKTLKRVNALIKDIERSPFEGIGKPEPLRYRLQGYWSRRIDAENRLVYSVTGDRVNIVSCKDHYSGIDEIGLR
jgi:toxin YoeB